MGHLREGGGQLLHAGRLLRGPLAEGLGPVGHLVGPVGHLARRRPDLIDDVAEYAV